MPTGFDPLVKGLKDATDKLTELGNELAETGSKGVGASARGLGDIAKGGAFESGASVFDAHYDPAGGPVRTPAHHGSMPPRQNEQVEPSPPDQLATTYLDPEALRRYIADQRGIPPERSRVRRTDTDGHERGRGGSGGEEDGHHPDDETGNSKS